MTVLFYLNNVTGGGETVFPVADNRTYDEMVRANGLLYYSWAGSALGKCIHTLPDHICLSSLQPTLAAWSCNGWQSKAIITLLPTESDSGQR